MVAEIEEPRQRAGLVCVGSVHEARRVERVHLQPFSLQRDG